jgi:hypothetical protein
MLQKLKGLDIFSSIQTSVDDSGAESIGDAVPTSIRISVQEKSLRRLKFGTYLEGREGSLVVLTQHW